MKGQSSKPTRLEFSSWLSVKRRIGICKRLVTVGALSEQRGQSPLQPGVFSPSLQLIATEGNLRDANSCEGAQGDAGSGLPEVTPHVEAGHDS